MTFMGNKGNLNQEKVSLRAKIALMLLGIFLCLFLIEIGLRLGGFAIMSYQEYRNWLSLKKKGAYTIMCIGESTTGCGGEDSYPWQLEEILKTSNIGATFSVVNKGVPAKDTTEICNSLDTLIKKFHPDMVIAMMGINDDWDLVNREAPKKRSWLSELRLYKLANRLFPYFFLDRGISLPPERVDADTLSREDNPPDPSLQDIPDETFRRSPESEVHIRAGKKLHEEGYYELAEREFRKSIELDSRDRLAYDLLGASLVFGGKDADALILYKDFKTVTPHNVMVYYAMGKVHFYRDEYDEAVTAFLTALKLSKAQRFPEFDREEEGALGVLAFLSELKGDKAKNIEYSNALDRLEAKYVNSITRTNYIRVKNILQENGIKLVAVQYAMRKCDYLRNMLSPLPGIIFVDNERLFKDVVKKYGCRKYFTDMWASDFGHCTQEGNRILAKNIANVILKEVFHK
jgi:tetratricopeptide (TPR) repeat protein